ncbi:MAG: sugar isomerase domain-containing protein [Bacillota bacterium]
MNYALEYFEQIKSYLEQIIATEREGINQAAKAVADHIKEDKIVYVYGPGGHSNLGSQELFFRAGGLMHVSAILDEGTLLSGGALRSMAIERTPGYGKVVIQDYGLEAGDLLIIVNAYGINAATIDAALEAKRLGVKTIGVSSAKHATSTPAEHPARHPSKQNLHDTVDIAIDSKVEVGDAVIEMENLEQKVGAMSTFVNAYILNSISMEAIALLVEQGIQPPIWKSGNSTGGDEWNQQFISRFKNKIKKL